MGLFKKKQPGNSMTGAPQTSPTASRSTSEVWSRRASAGDLATLRAELTELRTRLEAREREHVAAEARMAALDATTTAIVSNRLGGDDLLSRVADLEGQLQSVANTAAAAAAAADAAAQKATTLAAIPHSTADPVLAARVDAIVTRLDALATPIADPQLLAQLDALAARVEAADTLGAQIGELQRRLDQLQANSANPEASSLTEGLASQLAQLAERVSANDIAARQAAEQVAGLDQRLAAVSTELANQLRELGNDIDGLADHQTAGPPGVIDDQVLDALRAGQVKLAAEQARYEIAFRNDLAALAEQVRRTGH